MLPLFWSRQPGPRTPLNNFSHRSIKKEVDEFASESPAKCTVYSHQVILLWTYCICCTCRERSLCRHSNSKNPDFTNGIVLRFHDKRS